MEHQLWGYDQDSGADEDGRERGAAECCHPPQSQRRGAAADDDVQLGPRAAGLLPLHTRLLGAAVVTIRWARRHTRTMPRVRPAGELRPEAKHVPTV